MTEPRLFDQDDVAGTPRGDGVVPDAAPTGASRPATAYPAAPEVVVLPDAGPGAEGSIAEVDLDRYVRLPRRSTPLVRWSAVVGGMALIAVLVVGFVWSWLQRQIDPPGGAGPSVTFVVPAGATTDEVATLLEEEGIIAHATVFRYYSRWRGAESVRAGEYDLALNSSFDAVLERLAAGPAPLRLDRITIPEGLTVLELADLLEREIDGVEADDIPAALIRLQTDWRPAGEDSWEGILFPDTYEYAVGDDALAVLSRMNAQFDRVARSVGLDPDMGLDPVTGERIGLTAYEIIVIASLIEKETRIPEERPQVARVIYNRIFLDMTLGIDATVLYARGPDRTGPITSADLAIDSPFNTRLNPGLPPTPIAAPGRASLAAALEPVDGPWLYYVLADADGRHFFTDDYDAFLRQRDESRALGLL